jgi:hypothetical protein
MAGVMSVLWVASCSQTRKETAVDEERERVKSAQDESDVEAHRVKARSEDSEAGDDPARRESDDDSDVEAHRFKA